MSYSVAQVGCLSSSALHLYVGIPLKLWSMANHCNARPKSNTALWTVWWWVVHVNQCTLQMLLLFFLYR